jgi:hypothetical protein
MAVYICSDEIQSFAIVSRSSNWEFQQMLLTANTKEYTQLSVQIHNLWMIRQHTHNQSPGVERFCRSMSILHIR